MAPPKLQKRSVGYPIYGRFNSMHKARKMASLSSELSPTAVFHALDLEGAPLVGALERAHEVQHGSLRFLRGFIGDTPLLVARTGIGKVAATLHASVAIQQFHARELIMVGAAGAIRSHLKLGDLFVANETIQHDLGVREGRRAHPDPALRAELLQWARSHSPTGRAFEGSLLTGDRACLTWRRRFRLQWAFRSDAPLCVDMESAALGAAAQALGVPFGILRIITDHAGPFAYREIRKHFHELAPEPARVLIAWLRTRNSSVLERRP